MTDLSRLRFGREIALLLRVALAIFVVTVVIGILNGVDLVDFGHKAILTHVHAGTLGWITLSVFASTFWLFGEAPATGWRASLPRVLAPLATGVVVVYVVAFLTTYGVMRPVLGTAAGLAILGVAAWTVAQARTMVLGVPHWGMLAALATSVIGAVFGILWGFMISSGRQLLPEGGEDAHPATMVVGFLLPVGMALTEWWLRPESITTRADRAGFVQMVALFAGGVALMLGVLLDSVPLIGMNLPLEVLAVVLFLRRNRTALRRVAWREASAPRLFAVSSYAIVANIAFIAYLIVRYKGDFDDVPDRLLLALDHTMFIGVVTTSVFGLLTSVTARRRDVVQRADDVVFWFVVVGLAGFVAGLLFDVVVLKRLFTPFMGTGILVGLGTFAMRLRAGGERVGVP